MFDAEKVKNNCVAWIRQFFDENGVGCNAVVGISGGKDSSIVAALCKEALGQDRVFGLLMPMPYGVHPDIGVALDLVNYLEISYNMVNIEWAVASIKSSLGELEWTEQAKINLPARIRMTTLYAFSQNLNGRVANTCNLSENYVGYSTIFGDAAGDFSPLANLTVTEVKAIGRLLLPDRFIDKVPSDGLCGKTDEENLGFSYEKDLDPYIRTGYISSFGIRDKIERLHHMNAFKEKPMAKFVPDI